MSPDTPDQREVRRRRACRWGSPREAPGVSAWTGCRTGGSRGSCCPVSASSSRRSSGRGRCWSSAPARTSRPGTCARPRWRPPSRPHGPPGGSRSTRGRRSRSRCRCSRQQRHVEPGRSWEAAVVAVLLALATAADPTPGAFEVVSPAANRPVGKLVRLTPDLTATIGETTVRDVVSLRRVGRPLPTFPTGPHLVTAAGDRLAGELLGGDGSALRFAPTGVPGSADEPWLVPLSAASALWLADTPADTPPDPARYPWADGNRNRDLLRSRNGDTARGILAGLADGPAFRFRPDGGESRTVAAKDVAAVAFNPTLTRVKKPKGPVVRAVLADGSRLVLATASVADNTLTGEAVFGAKVSVPLDAVAALDVLGGKAAYLSDLKPTKAEQVGFLGPAWPWAADRTVRGAPLRLGDSTFDKGLGTHPRTVLTYDLGGKYRRFEAVVGLDPATGDRGRAAVRVRADGKEVAVPGLADLAAGKPVAVRVDVTGAKTLTLEVDFGPAGGVRADVNWADARVVE
ncbi:MAG: hypothetical protein C0501_22095 [Isosphaera sp.]|nr:hypothetical protein [Isosphaera sp.]